MSRKFRYRRTSEIKMTNEARVLRRLRLDSGTKIKEVAKEIGKSEAYIRHIEHGRLDVPDRAIVKKILEVYGASYRIYSNKLKSSVELDSRLQLKHVIPQLNLEESRMVLAFIQSIKLN
jgi:transcriptional regulator with XRE-family HTH domain